MLLLLSSPRSPFPPSSSSSSSAASSFAFSSHSSSLLLNSIACPIYFFPLLIVLRRENWKHTHYIELHLLSSMMYVSKCVEVQWEWSTFGNLIELSNCFSSRLPTLNFPSLQKDEEGKKKVFLFLLLLFPLRSSQQSAPAGQSFHRQEKKRRPDGQTDARLGERMNTKERPSSSHCFEFVFFFSFVDHLANWSP